MKPTPKLLSTLLLSVAGLLAAAPAWAQGARNAEVLDYSMRSLISEAEAKQIVNALIPERAWKVFPRSKYVYISQVEGGITQGGICAVTARVMLMPLTPTAKAVLFRPQEVATAFDALPSADMTQCKGLAAAKLKEATTGVMAAIVKQ